MRLPVAGKDVDDPVDGLGRRDGVQGGEHEMAGFGGFQGQFDGFQVAHFADENDVRVFAQGAAQGRCKGAGVAADLALVDQAARRSVHEFDGVFDGDDVVAPVVGGVAQHGGQGGGFARAGGAGDENQALGAHGQFAEDGRQAQLGQGGHVFGNGPKSGGHAAFLAKIVAAQPSHARDGVGEIKIAGGFED